MKYLKYITIALFAIALALTCYHVIICHTASTNYYNRTEALLDSICAWDESFMDTTMETDTYYEYTVAKDNLLKVH